MLKTEAAFHWQAILNFPLGQRKSNHALWAAQLNSGLRANPHKIWVLAELREISWREQAIALKTPSGVNECNGDITPVMNVNLA